MQTTTPRPRRKSLADRIPKPHDIEQRIISTQAELRELQILLRAAQELHSQSKAEVRHAGT